MTIFRNLLLAGASLRRKLTVLALAEPSCWLISGVMICPWDADKGQGRLEGDVAIMVAKFLGRELGEGQTRVAGKLNLAKRQDTPWSNFGVVWEGWK